MILSLWSVPSESYEPRCRHHHICYHAPVAQMTDNPDESNKRYKISGFMLENYRKGYTSCANLTRGEVHV